VVRFPSVRVKLRVLAAARASKTRQRTATRENDHNVRVREDWSPRVQRARRRLAAFARGRARLTRRRWALRGQDLFMDGRVFAVVNGKVEEVRQLASDGENE